MIIGAPLLIYKKDAAQVNVAYNCSSTFFTATEN